jgi:hypothetical protein
MSTRAAAGSVTLVSSVFLAAWAVPLRGGAPATRPADAVAAAARQPSPAGEMLRAADAVLRLLQEQQDVGGAALTADFVSLKLDWSRRRVEAVKESRPGPQAEREALEGHLQLAKRALALSEARWRAGGDASLIPVEQSKYFAAEAELWVARAAPAAAQNAAPPAAPALRMVNAADQVLRLLQEQEDVGGRALDFNFLTLKLDWSRRRVQAVRESQQGPEAEAAALRAHLERAKRTRDVLEGRWQAGADVSRIPGESVKYYLAEAELWAAPAAGVDPAAAPAARLASARAMAAAAAEVLRLMQEQQDVGGRAMDPSFVASQLEWSRRRVHAVRQAQAEPQEQAAAVQAHLEQARRTRDAMERRYRAGGDASLIGVETAKYFTAEAELWVSRLAEVGKKGPAPAGR